MTWFLKDRLEATVEPLTRQVTDAWEEFGGSARLAQLQGGTWNPREGIEADIMDEMAQALGGWDAVMPTRPEDMSRFWNPATRPDYLMDRAQDMIRMEPEAWGPLPQNRAQFDGETDGRYTREGNDLMAMQAAGDHPWMQTFGAMVGSIGPTDVALALIGGEFFTGGKITGKALAKFMLAEGAINAAAEVPHVIAAQDIAEKYGWPAPNAAAQIAMGAVAGTGLAGIVGGAMTVVERLAGRRVAEDAAARAAGKSTLDTQAATDRAEDALRAGREPRMQPIRPNPQLPAEQDPAVLNFLKLTGQLEAPRGFDQVYSGTIVAPPRALTTMTVREVMDWQQANIAAGAASTAAGRFQIISGTLTDVVREMGLTGDEVFDEALQTRMAVHLMKRKGLDDWRAGRMSDEDFANAMATEWAALPVVTGPNAGRSHYAGDGLNNALTDVDTVLAVLRGAEAPDNPPGGGSGYAGGASRQRSGRSRTTAPDEVVTPQGTRIEVTYRVVEADSLIPASGDLQPRDRSRAASGDQVNEIKAAFDPTMLMPRAESDLGTPIVGPDSIIESGNGRVLAIKAVAAENPEAFGRYVQAIRDEGFDVPEGMRVPVLVAERTTDLPFEARRNFVRESNLPRGARLSATEQARFDADYLGQDAFDAYRPGKGIAKADNAEFVRRIFAQMSPAERGALMDRTGGLNVDGLDRIRAALFARAFDGAPDLLQLALETESRSVTNLIRMLQDMAPDWAAFRAMIDAGMVRREFDITGAMMEAVRIIARARSEGRDGQSIIAAIRDRLAQGDMFAARDPLTEALIDAFYKGDRARGVDATQEILERYAAEAVVAGRHDIADLTDAPPAPDEVLARAIAGQEGRTPFDPLPARVEPPPEPGTVIAAMDPAPWTDGTAGPEAQAADAALTDTLFGPEPDPIPATADSPAIQPPRPKDPGIEVKLPDGDKLTAAKALELIEDERQLDDVLEACRISRGAR